MRFFQELLPASSPGISCKRGFSISNGQRDFTDAGTTKKNDFHGVGQETCEGNGKRNA